MSIVAPADGPSGAGTFLIVQGITMNRYFHADDGEVRYLIVANDRDHALELINHTQAVLPDVTEISASRAAEIDIAIEDDGGDGAVETRKLNTFEPGDWFATEGT